MKKCPKCGFFLDDAAEKCTNCSYIFNEQIQSAKQRKLTGPIKSTMRNLTLGLIALFFFISLIVASAQGGVVFGLAFTFLWIGMIAAIMLFLAALKYIIGLAIVGLILATIISFATGQGVAGAGFMGAIVGIIGVLFILGLTILIYTLAPSVLAGLAVFALTNNVIIAIIVFAIVAIVTYKVILPFMIGYIICITAGQFALLIAAVGFSAKALQSLLSGTSSTTDITQFASSLF
ncbi:hypothetical protein MUP77_21570, partial [Candidatus Bathyarchaeota archaeon]|nr:hypothetical protein [Candidatus Bathyarchaeota archaeon]